MPANEVRQADNYGFDPRIRVFRCGQTVDTFAILTERFLVLVDTMVNLESIQEVLNALQDDWDPGQPDQALLVVNTHGDWDHVWGNGLFIGRNARYPAPVIGHRLTAHAMTTPAAGDLLARFKAEHPGEYDSAELFPPTVLFDGELALDGGDLTLRLIHTPGHTADHCAVWIPEIATLLAGDAAEVPMPLVHAPEDVPVLRASLRRMQELESATVLCCHAPGFASPAVIDNNIDYFDALEQRCRSVVSTRKEASDEQLLETLDWPLESALPPGMSVKALEQPDFYRAFHRANSVAMLGWVGLSS